MQFALIMTPLSGWRRATLGFGAGILVGLGQVPFSLWPFALAGLSGVIWLIVTAPDVRRAALAALFAGAGHFALALHWITEPFQVDAARHGWMAPFALLFMAFGLALFWVVAGAAAHRFGGIGRLGRIMTLVVTLALAEAVRGHVMTGFPWALVGHVWIGFAPMQLAAWIGSYGLTLVTLLLCGLVVARGLGCAMAAAALLAGLFSAGLYQGAQALPDAPGPVVRLVQPNAAQHLKWDPLAAQEFYERQLRFTAEPPRVPGDPYPDLVIWPETAVPFLLNRPGAGLTGIAAAARGVPVALGIQRTEGWRAYNSLVVIDADAEVTALYDKHHLVPFGEYFPLGDLALDLFGITAFAAQEGRGYSAGPGPTLIDLGPVLGRVLPLICYEAVFPQDIRAAPARPDWMLQVTNDAWFGALSGPYQHLSLARLRAIEQGLPLIRSANTGVSAVIDARGGITASIPLNESGWLDAALPGALAETVYARWGEVPFLALLALVAVGALGTRRARH